MSALVLLEQQWRNDPDAPRLWYRDTGGGFEIAFHGCPMDNYFEQLLATLAQPNVAQTLRSLHLSSPDEGANGLCCWDLAPLVDAVDAFPLLEQVEVALTGVGAHNQVLLGALSDFPTEGSVLSRLASKAPRLRYLQAPSAPDPAFFEGRNEPLTFLNIDAGRDTQNCVAHAAQGQFLALTYFGYGETSTLAHRATAADFASLLLSSAMPMLQHLVLRNPAFSHEEVVALRHARPDLAIQLIRSTTEYVA